MTFLLNHETGCTPYNPCNSCKAMSFLRQKLKPSDLTEFLSYYSVIVPPTKECLPLDTPIEDLCLSVRSANALFNAKIRTIGDLLKHTDRELLRLPNLGRRSLIEIKEALWKAGHKPPDVVSAQDTNRFFDSER